MFKTRLSFLVLLLAVALLALGCGSSDQKAAKQSAKNESSAELSGHIEDGLRVLVFDPTAQDQHFTIHRGDYVKPRLTNGEPFNLKIATLKVDQDFPAPEGEKPYFKVPDTGSFRFSVGEGRGVIEAIPLAASSYREVSSSEAAEFIATAHPFILDVRTPGEYAAGHLADATLIPVQEFQKRVTEIASHKDDPVLVYCSSGNRSTVAAKIMVDYGFTNVVNLRHGIVEWLKTGHPIVK